MLLELPHPDNAHFPQSIQNVLFNNDTSASVNQKPYHTSYERSEADTCWLTLCSTIVESQLMALSFQCKYRSLVIHKQHTYTLVLSPSFVSVTLIPEFPISDNPHKSVSTICTPCAVVIQGKNNMLWVQEHKAARLKIVAHTTVIILWSVCRSPGSTPWSQELSVFLFVLSCPLKSEPTERTLCSTRSPVLYLFSVRPWSSTSLCDGNLWRSNLLSVWLFNIIS